ncbi:MAG: helix-turn-helix transcriptional regulator [Clostridia bacterium]|nr:helix-turn-helix transcriptional regulator [Clostridia bacterium]
MEEEIGKRIKNIRENMNMPKESFAKLLGVSGQYLGIVERGKSYLSIEKLKILCDISNLSADYILFGKDDNKPNNTKEILSEFSDEQLEIGCDVLKHLALLIKKL